MIPFEQRDEVNRRMCKPGYGFLSIPYSKSGGKCVAGLSNSYGEGAAMPSSPDLATPDDAVKQERAKRSAPTTESVK